MLMPGRQYLHVVDNLNIDRAPTLLDIVINTRHRDCSKKVDKIFGVLGAASQHEDIRDEVTYFNDMVNYSDEDITPVTLYTEFARYYIQDKGDLRVLQACNPRTSSAIRKLPSWAADWSDIDKSHQLSSHIYDAAKGTKVNAKYDPKDFAMTVTGHFIDRVGIACNDRRIDALEHLIDESSDWDHWRDAIIETYVRVYAHGTYRGNNRHLEYSGFPTDSCWAQLVDILRATDRYVATGEAVSEAFWRCLLVDKMPGTKMDANRRIDTALDVCQRFHRKALRRVLDPGLSKTLKRDFLHRERDARRKPSKPEATGYVGHNEGWFGSMQRSVLHKRFFVTKKRGLFGMAPANLQPGDLVCVLDGGTVPFLLRENGTNREFTFVEEAYLHGYMDGRAVDEAEISNDSKHVEPLTATTEKRSFRIR